MRRTLFDQMSKLVRQNNTRRLARVVAKHDEADFGKV